MTSADVNQQDNLTVYFDGSCPLCRAEIAHYRRRDASGNLNFSDVSNPEQILTSDLTRERAMARLHVRRGDGKLVSGAAAFVEIWRRLPGWRHLAPVASLPGVLQIIELLYRLFLPIRPIVSRLFGRIVAAQQRN